MPYNQKQNVYWKNCWFCVCMIVGLGQIQAQTFMDVLKSGETIKVEWVQQALIEQRAKLSPDIPLFPEELKPGESEIRVGLNLKSIGEGHRLMAEIDYINYMTFPISDESLANHNTNEVLTQPIILDTRFRDQYFHPILFQFEALLQQTLPISCDLEPYQLFFDQFSQLLEQHPATKLLLNEQLEWLKETNLPEPFTTSDISAFFCELMELDIPKDEGTIRLQNRKQRDNYYVDYFKVDSPAKICVLNGSILSPATDQVRIHLFQEGDWLTYWRDSLVQLDKEGNFQLSFPLDHPRMLMIYHGYQRMRFYLEPGDTLQFRTNANAFYSAMEIQGNAKAENEFLLNFYHQMRRDTIFRPFDDDLLEKEHIPFFQKIKTKETTELAFLNGQAPSLRTSFTTLMDRYLRLEHANDQWQSAHRFMMGKRIVLEPELLYHLQQLSSLLYRLPYGKNYDFDIEHFLIFQYALLQSDYHRSPFNLRENMALAQLLPSKETYVRHMVMQLFRKYSQLGELTESGQWQLAQLLEIVKDSQLIQEMAVLAEGNRNVPPAVGFRTIPRGRVAPPWSYVDKEGVEVGLKDFAGKKLLLHIGWIENLDIAMTDIQPFQEAEASSLEIVHLLAATDKDEFINSIADKNGLFIYLSSEEMDILKEQYFIANSSNHYFLIGEDGKILANHYHLGTANKLQGTLEKMANLPVVDPWTPEQKLQFWRSLGIGALILLLISGLILWQRRIIAQRNLRQQKLMEIELRGIRSQMNPHFLFNAMSSIQNLIRKQEQEKADLYLGQFAGLMRKTLRNTAEEYIPLINEIETLEHYCSLESLRHPFKYEFQVDERIDAYNTYIPGMILQPIIENAIIHGLSPQTGDRILQMKIAPGQQGLSCTISDNGIGILAAQKYNKSKSHQSIGMKLVRQRLELLGLNGQEHLSIIDRSTLHPPERGTRVSLTIPVEQ